MIIGIGTDLVDIDRIQEAIEKSSKFISRVYGEAEIAWLESIHYRTESAAANFAGKEAVLKVFGTGLRQCKLKEIEILRNELGKPFVVLSGGAAQLAASLEINEIQISLAHSKNQALAYAIGIRSENHVISK